MAIRIGSAATRRRFLATSAAATAFTTIGGIARPFISRANDRPVIYLYHTVRFAAHDADLSGLDLRPDGILRVAFAQFK